jgi:hypothetical protein
MTLKNLFFQTRAFFQANPIKMKLSALVAIVGLFCVHFNTDLIGQLPALAMALVFRTYLGFFLMFAIWAYLWEDKVSQEGA